MRIVADSPFASRAEFVSRLPSTIRDALTCWGGTGERMRGIKVHERSSPCRRWRGILATAPGCALRLTTFSERSLAWRGPCAREKPARGYDQVSTHPFRAYVHADELEGARHRGTDGARWVEESAWRT